VPLAPGWISATRSLRQEIRTVDPENGHFSRVQKEREHGNSARRNSILEDLMIRVLAFAFCATTFALVLTHEASALRRGGVHAGDLRGANFRGAYRGGLRGYRGYRGIRAGVWGGRRYGAGRRWYGYAGRPYRAYGAAALAGAYAYNYPSYSYAYMSPSPYSTIGATGTTAAAKTPGMCGTYFYWKGGSCVDARAK
jgi:hypothetical protein